MARYLRGLLLALPDELRKSAMAGKNPVVITSNKPITAGQAESMGHGSFPDWHAASAKGITHPSHATGAKGEHMAVANAVRPLEQYTPAGKKILSRLGKSYAQLKALEKAEANPDEKADAKLGEDVEHLVEEHFEDNKEAESKEGHGMVSKGNAATSSGNSPTAAGTTIIPAQADGLVGKSGPDGPGESSGGTGGSSADPMLMSAMGKSYAQLKKEGTRGPGEHQPHPGPSVPPWWKPKPAGR